MKKIMLLPLLFFVTELAWASSSCFEASELYQKQGDEYYNLDNPLKLTRHQEVDIKSLLGKIKGEWKGQMVETICSGSDRSPKRKVNTHTALVRISVTVGKPLKMDVKNKRDKDGVTRSDRVFLLARGSIYELMSDKKNISSTEKIRIGYPNGGSQIFEKISKIKYSQDRLTIEMHNYANTVYIGSQQFSLTKD